MAASSADAPTDPDAAVRPSDAERERAVSELGERFAEGRLSQETFLHRIDEAFSARDRRQLDGLFTDLPRRVAPFAGTGRSLSALCQSVGNSLRDAARDGARLVRSQPRAHPRTPGAAPVARPARALFFPPTGPGTPVSYSIGRDSGCDLLVEDTTVSRRHARLDREDGRWILTDCGSRNGTRVNGWRIRQPVPVQPGDHVMFGSALFIACAGQR